MLKIKSHYFSKKIRSPVLEAGKMAQSLKRLLHMHLNIVANVAVHAFNSSAGEAEAGTVCDLEANLVYRVSSRTARAIIQRNSVSN